MRQGNDSGDIKVIFPGLTFNASKQVNSAHITN